MDTPQNDLPEESLTPEIMEGPPPETRAASYVQAPKLMRIASMTRAMLDEVRQAPLMIRVGGASPTCTTAR